MTTTTITDILEDPRVTAQVDVASLDEDQKRLLRAMLDDDALAAAYYDGLDDFLESCDTMDYVSSKWLATMLDAVLGEDGLGFSFDPVGGGFEDPPELYEVSVWCDSLHCWLTCADDLDHVAPERFRDDGQTPLRAALSAFESIEHTRRRAQRALDEVKTLTSLVP